MRIFKSLASFIPGRSVVVVAQKTENVSTVFLVSSRVFKLRNAENDVLREMEMIATRGKSVFEAVNQSFKPI